MAAKAFMEQSPNFLSREQLQNIQFYKDWVRTALLEGLYDIDPLLRLKERVTLAAEDERFFQSKELDIATFKAAEAMIDAQIREEVDGAVRDLQTTVFEHGLFRVGIEIDDEVVAIDGVAAEGAVIVPVIAGEKYTGSFTDVLFDR